MLRHRTPKEQSVVIVLATVSTNYVVSLKLECRHICECTSEQIEGTYRNTDNIGHKTQNKDT